MMRTLMCVLLCAAARAAVAPSLTVDELVDRSAIIVHGRVARSWTAWDGAHKYIWTHHELEVIDPIRGSGFAPVIVSEPGGTLDGVGMKFSGSVGYAAGEEAIVFLYRTPIGYLRSVGSEQGKFTITPGLRVRGVLPAADLKARVRAAMRAR